MPQSVWVPTLPAALGARAMKAAREVAGRLGDQQRVGLAVATAPTQTAFPRTIHWQPQSVAQGDAGLALTCAYLDACLTDEGWDRVGHTYIAGAAEAAQRSPQASAGLFGGISGLAFAGWSLSRGATRYRRLLDTVDDTLFSLVATQVDSLGRVASGGTSFGAFDVISGLAGIGAYLLHRRQIPGADAAFGSVIQSLVDLASDTGGLPRWWTPSHLLGDEEIAAQYPYGNLNCGLAHGIPGPLALMALGLSHGIAVPGLAETVDRLAEWLAGCRADDGWGVNWPYAVPLTADGSPDLAGAARQPSRAAWCYGTPGVARSLWLAGVARDRPDWRNLAIEAMGAVYRRPITARQIDSPTFCHGVAGLLQVTLRFANDTRLPVFAKAAADLTEWLLNAYEPDSLLGYRNWEPGGTRVDHAGLLDGAPGVLLALLAAVTDVEPAWDRAFLLA